MSAEKRPPERRPPASAADAAQRLATIVDAAERAAASVIDDAEQQAQRHLDEARDRADRIVAERLRELADQLDPPGSGERRSRPPEAGRGRRRRGRGGEPQAPRRSGSAGARLLATQMAVSGAEPRGDRSAAAQRLRDRGHQRDPRRDPRTGGVETYARRPDPDHGTARATPAERPHGNMRLLVAGLIAVIVGLVVAIVVIASDNGSGELDLDGHHPADDGRNDDRPTDDDDRDDRLDDDRTDDDRNDRTDDHRPPRRRPRRRRRKNGSGGIRRRMSEPAARAGPHRGLRGRPRRGAAGAAALLRRPRHQRDAEVDPGPLRRRGRLPHGQPRPARRGLRRDRGQGEAARRARVPRRRRPRALRRATSSSRRSRPTRSTAAATRCSPRWAGR